MFLLAYLFSAGLIWLLVLALSPSTRTRLGLFTTLSLAIALILAILFYLFSWLAGLVQFGVPQAWSYPQDYLVSGVTGLLIMLIPVTGVLSPLPAAWLLRRRSLPLGTP